MPPDATAGRAAAPRIYLCVTCGRYLLRARGPMAPVALDFTCAERRCRTPNTIWLDQVQDVTELMRHRWREMRLSWRRANSPLPRPVVT